MKTYVVTSGILFALIGIAHIWEVIDRHHFLVEDAVVFAASAGLAVWAWRLARKSAAR